MTKSNIALILFSYRNSHLLNAFSLYFDHMEKIYILKKIAHQNEPALLEVAYGNVVTAFWNDLDQSLGVGIVRGILIVVVLCVYFSRLVVFGLTIIKHVKLFILGPDNHMDFDLKKLIL